MFDMPSSISNVLLIAFKSQLYPTMSISPLLKNSNLLKIPWAIKGQVHYLRELKKGRIVGVE